MGAAARRGGLTRGRKKPPVFLQGENAGIFRASDDGVTWSAVSSFDALIRDIIWCPEFGIFVACGYSGQIGTSPDGISWTFASTTPLGTGIMNALAWSPSLSLFAIVGNNGVLGTSPDGLTWTSRTNPGGSNDLKCVEWSPQIGKFSAAGSSGAHVHSYDGVSWTNQTSITSTSTDGISWSPDRSLYVGVGYSGVIKTDGNGAGVWTQQTTIGDNVYCVTWSNASYGWAVGCSAGGLFTSTNGTSWTSRNTLFSSGDQIYDIAWSEEVGLWVAVGSAGKIATSPTGVTWTLRTSGHSNESNAICATR